MRLIYATLLCLLSVAAAAQSDPSLAGCVYPNTPPEQGMAEKIMTLPLPYLDKQFLYYRDDSGAPTGSYAVRRALHIYIYDKNNVLMGTAIRRSSATTAYFDADGSYLGNCVNRKLMRSDQRSVRFDAGAH